jgi:hypothetical protein
MPRPIRSAMELTAFSNNKHWRLWVPAQGRDDNNLRSYAGRLIPSRRSDPTGIMS